MINVEKVNFIKGLRILNILIITKYLSNEISY